MTIDKYYITFGFKVKLSSVMRKEGYTVETLTADLRDEYGSRFMKPTDEEIVLEWFRYDFLDAVVAGRHEFEIDGAKFVIRTFTHDKKEYDEYAVVGVDLGSIENFEGVLATTGLSGIDSMRRLVKNQDWASMIKECENVNARCHAIVDYGVENPKHETFSIVPKTFITTNDCGCCS